LLILEDTPRRTADWAYAAFHVWSFNGVSGIGWRGRVRSEPEWKELFPEVGLRLLATRSVPRRERWPPIARTVFVAERMGRSGRRESAA
jgi:hypothetical protein